VDKYASVLDDGMIKHIKDGWVEITVGEPMDFVLNQGYIDATKAGAKNHKLGPKVGELEGYLAGRPFPVLLLDSLVPWPQSSEVW